MLEHLYNILVKASFGDGVLHPYGWGSKVKRDILPLLKHPKLYHHYNIIKEGLKRSKEPIEVFVVGEGKFGKSTLINALAKSDIAETDFLPKTWYISRYIPSQKKKECYTIHYDNHLSSAKRFEEDMSNFDGEINIEKGIISFSNKDNFEKALLHEEKATGKNKQTSPIWQVNRYFSSLKQDNRNFVLVDTPGIRQIRTTSAKIDSIDDFYHKADVVLWVLTADKINSQESKIALNSMSRYGKPIIIVVNRADKIPQDQRDRVHSDVYKNFSSVQGVEKVVLVSALNAFKSLSDENYSLAESGLLSLENSIFQLVDQKGEIVKNYSLYKTCQQAAKECSLILEQEAERLRFNLQTLEENRNIAESYSMSAKSIIDRELARVATPIKTSATATMRRTADLHSLNEKSPIFNEQATISAIQNKVKEELTNISRVLNRELQIFQEQISVRPYLDQTYGADATISSHLSLTSLELKTDHVAKEINIKEFSPAFSFSHIFQSMIEGVADFFASFFGWGKERTPEEKAYAKRSRKLERYISGLDSVVNPCVMEMKNLLLSSTSETTTQLVSEVNSCFERQFGTTNSIEVEIKKCITSSKKSVVPNFLEAPLKMLKSRIS